MKRNEGYVYKNLLDKRKKVNLNFQVIALVKTADLKKPFSKGDTTKRSYKVFKMKKIVIDTIPSYHIDILPERYNKAFLKRTNLSLR